MFPKLLDVGCDRRVRHLQIFRHTAVVHFDLEHLRIGIALRKFENVLKVRTTPGVDRLRVVAHHHQVAMVARDQVDKIGLDFVRVLVFVAFFFFSYRSRTSWILSSNGRKYGNFSASNPSSGISVFTTKLKISASTSPFGNRISFGSIPALATTVLIKSF